MKKWGGSLLEACSGSGRHKLPNMTPEDQSLLRKPPAHKSPHRMKLPSGGKDLGKWTGKDVRAPLLEKTGRKIALATCVLPWNRPFPRTFHTQRGRSTPPTHTS